MVKLAPFVISLKNCILSGLTECITLYQSNVVVFIEIMNYNVVVYLSKLGQNLQ